MGNRTGFWWHGQDLVVAYTDSWKTRGRTLVNRRIKPYFEEQAGKERRAAQTRVYRRNQALGLVLIAMAIVVFWLFRTNPKWIFPTGWWRP